MPARVETFAKVAVWRHERAVVVLSLSLDPVEKLSLLLRRSGTRFLWAEILGPEKEISGTSEGDSVGLLSTRWLHGACIISGQVMKARFALLALSIVALPAQDSFLPLKARPLWKPDPNLPLRTVDWEPILANPEIRFLADNQLSVSVSKEPGLSRIHYFPVRRRPSSSANSIGVRFKERTSSLGVCVRFRDRAGNNVTLQETEYRWWPHRIERRWKNEQYEIHESLP